VINNILDKKITSIDVNKNCKGKENTGNIGNTCLIVSHFGNHSLGVTSSHILV
jgi:hypothetical protein